MQAKHMLWTVHLCITEMVLAPISNGIDLKISNIQLVIFGVNLLNKFCVNLCVPNYTSRFDCRLNQKTNKKFIEIHFSSERAIIHC